MRNSVQNATSNTNFSFLVADNRFKKYADISICPKYIENMGWSTLSKEQQRDVYQERKLKSTSYRDFVSYSFLLFLSPRMQCIRSIACLLVVVIISILFIGQSQSTPLDELV
jgi:hypothetical protein